MAMEYGYEKTFKNLGFEDAVAKVTEALKVEGFGVLTEIDVKATLKKKLDVDFRRYTILGACNPNLAYRALQAEPQIGLLLPCNVVVQEEGGGVTVSLVSPPAMFSVVQKKGLESVVSEADARLRRVLEALG